MKKELLEHIDRTIRYATVQGDRVGAKIGDGIQTVQETQKYSPGLIVNPVDRLITICRGQSNPLPVIAARLKPEMETSQRFSYYEVDVTPTKSTTKAKILESSNLSRIELDTQNNSLFPEKNTIIFKGIDGYDDAGVNKVPHTLLMGYIVSKTSDGKPIVVIVNGKKHPTIPDQRIAPDIPQGTVVIRGGKAQNETDVQTGKYSRYPIKKEQFIQKYRTQVEESTSMRVSKKEVEFTLTDLEEQAIFEMARDMTKNIILGAKGVTTDDEGEEVYLTGGVWPLIGKDFAYNKSVGFTKEDFIEMHRRCFVDNNGSKRKTAFVGSELMSRWSILDLGNEVTVSTTERFDLEFRTMRTSFGVLDVIFDESMDEVGLSDCAMILDENFLGRKDLAGVKDTETLDLRKSGQRDVDAKVINRAFAMYLKNPTAHMRVIPMS